jgi:hypothetical protein
MIFNLRWSAKSWQCFYTLFFLQMSSILRERHAFPKLCAPSFPLVSVSQNPDLALSCASLIIRIHDKWAYLNCLKYSPLHVYSLADV